MYLELFAMWKLGMIKEYKYDIVLMLRYCRDEIVAGAPDGRPLITREEYKKLRNLLANLGNEEPESNSTEYEEYFGEFYNY